MSTDIADKISKLTADLAALQGGDPCVFSVLRVEGLLIVQLRHILGLTSRVEGLLIVQLRHILGLTSLGLLPLFQRCYWR